VAVNIDRTIIKKKSWLGVLPLISLSTASVLSFFVKLVKRVIAILLV